MKLHCRISLVLIAALVLLPGCRSTSNTPGLHPTALTTRERSKPNRRIGQIYAATGHQHTGVAVSQSGRVFVNFPRWDASPDAYSMAVGEIGTKNTIKPYPPDAAEGDSWNRFSPDPRTPPAGDCFVCVQSVHVDGRDRLWVLDPAAPLFAGVLRAPAAGGGGPKLVEIDLKSDKVVRVIRFDETIAPPKSYLNDVRIELSDNSGEKTDYAYITDSGLGAIIVVDLSTNKARRLLASSPTTQADPNLVPIVGGRPLRGADGQVPRIHSDGIALDHRGGFLYWQALTSRRLFGCATSFLRDESLSPSQLDAAVKDLGPTVMTDGMECDASGTLYFSAVEQDAIVARTPDGLMHTLISDPAIAWPDSFALSHGRMPRTRKPQPLLVFTTAQIHRTKMFSPNGASPTEPYRVLVIPTWR